MSGFDRFPRRGLGQSCRQLSDDETEQDQGLGGGPSRTRTWPGSEEIPKENEKDLKDIPSSISKQLEFVTVDDMDEVLPHALVLAPGETLFTEHDMHFEMSGEDQDKHAPIN